MFERFTDQARLVVVEAQSEARMLAHNYIGTEHLLLGLLSANDGVTAAVLSQLGVSLPAVRAQVQEIIGRGGTSPSGHIPFTPRAKYVLELSLREALELRHGHIGPEHILLALVREGEGVAAQVLVKLGATLDRTRQGVLAVVQRGEVPEASGDGPTCPVCRLPLSGNLVYRVLTAAHVESDAVRDVTVVYCSACGSTLEMLSG